MKQVLVYSQYSFECMCKTKHLNDSNVESTLDAYVCVHNSKDMSPFFKEEHSNVLNLFFDDWTPEEVEKMPNDDFKRNLVLFNQNMADQLKNFLNENKNSNVWHVHCLAGISRSGAIALWLARNFNLDEYALTRKFSLDPNKHVLRLLNKMQTENN